MAYNKWGKNAWKKKHKFSLSECLIIMLFLPFILPFLAIYILIKFSILIALIIIGFIIYCLLDSIPALLITTISCLILIKWKLPLINAKLFKSNEKDDIENDNSINIEYYARECNAYIEHQEEMEEYKRFYNIEEEDE